MISDARRESWNKYVSSINSSTNSGEVWRKIKTTDKGHNGVKKIILKVGNSIIHSNDQVAEHFAMYFANIGVSTPDITRGIVDDGITVNYSQVEDYNKNFTTKILKKCL